MDIEKIVSEFQLIATSVESLQVENELIQYSEQDAGIRNIDVDFDVRAVDNDDSSGQLVGILNLHIAINCEIDERNLKINLVQQGVFTSPNTMKPEVFRKMLRCNGCASLYSVARGVISSISSQLFTCGNITIPMVNFIRFNEITSGQKNN